MPIYALGALAPQIDPQSWVAPNATVIGQVRLAKNVSIWWNSVVRGDTDCLTIDENTNIQDSCVVHSNRGIPVHIGRDVTIAHMVMLHGCTIGDATLIGMGAVLLNHSVIGKNSIVAAHTLIPEGKVFPERSLIMGSPGKVVLQLSDEEVARIPETAQRYVKNWQRYRDELIAL